MRQDLNLFLQGANLMEHGYIAVMESHQNDMRENLSHAHLQSQRQISFQSNNDWACQISMHKLASVAISLSLQALSHHSNQSNYSTAPIKISKPWHMMNCRTHLKLLACKT